MPKAKGRSEAIFTTEFGQSVKHALLGTMYRYEKLADLGLKMKYDSELFLPRKRYLGIEIKINKHERLLQFSKFFKGREHQLKELNLNFNLGNESYIIINCYHPRQHNYALVFSILQWNNFMAAAPSRTSIALDDPIIERYSVRMDQYTYQPTWKKDNKLWEVKEALKL